MANNRVNEQRNHIGITMKHQNAEIFMALADGKKITVTAPWFKGEEVPLEDCSSTVLHELHHPGSTIPTGIKFHVKG